MKSQKEIEEKIKELEKKEAGLEEEFEEQVEDEDLEEGDEAWEELRDDYDFQKEIAERQAKILKWVIED